MGSICFRPAVDSAGQITATRPRADTVWLYTRSYRLTSSAWVLAPHQIRLLRAMRCLNASIRLTLATCQAPQLYLLGLALHGVALPFTVPQDVVRKRERAPMLPALTARQVLGGQSVGNEIAVAPVESTGDPESDQRGRER
ncbi:hypothetical protein CSPX01_16316 [Colletotrichum filicis]|nr:hypothetical protein CSPX01_16316 [Colletotrichum filicis]